MTTLTDPNLEVAGAKRMALLLNLGELGTSAKYGFFGGGKVGDLIERFFSELIIILEAIDRCESLHEPNAQTKGWVNRARELAYDGDDWAELFFYRVVQVSSGGCTALGSRILSRLRCDRHMLVRVIGSELQELKERAVELMEQWRRLSFPVDPLEPVDPRLPTCFVDVGCLVGFDGPIEEVTKMVTGAGGKTEPKVVSIVGMAGSGKTTLAAAVYRQLRQQNCFHLQAFVSVGQKAYTVEQALYSMLSESELDDSPQGGPFEDIEDIDQLISRIREILNNKR